MRTTHELFIGGPVDGQTLLADATMPYWVVALYDDLPVRPYAGSPFADRTMIQTARYRRLHLGHRVVFVHEQMSDERAIDRLLNQYFPPAP
jgi:hypothetical protein